MRILPVLTSLILGIGVPASLCGQTKDSMLSHTEAALTYTYILSSTSPTPTGQPSHFSMSGVSATGAYSLRSHLSAVLDFSGTHINGVENTGDSLTLLITSAGARYTVRPVKHIRPFAQVLVGEVHATGSVYPPNSATGGGADSYAFSLGAGGDYALSPVVSLRAGASYLYTGLPNASTNEQSNLRVDAGLVFHFGTR